MSASVPNNELYKFTKQRPKYEKSYSGSIYLDGEKNIISCSPITYMTGYLVNTYSEMASKELSNSKNQERHVEEVEFANRKAIKMDLIDTRDNQFYGYEYRVDIDDINSGEFVLIRVLNNKLDTVSTEELLNDEEVKSILESIVFSK